MPNQETITKRSLVDYLETKEHFSRIVRHGFNDIYRSKNSNVSLAIPWLAKRFSRKQFEYLLVESQEYSIAEANRMFYNILKYSNQ